MAGATGKNPDRAKKNNNPAGVRKKEPAHRAARSTPRKIAPKPTAASLPTPTAEPEPERTRHPTTPSPQDWEPIDFVGATNMPSLSSCSSSPVSGPPVIPSPHAFIEEEPRPETTQAVIDPALQNTDITTSLPLQPSMAVYGMPFYDLADIAVKLKDDPAGQRLVWEAVYEQMFGRQGPQQPGGRSAFAQHPSTGVSEYRISEEMFHQLERMFPVPAKTAAVEDEAQVQVSPRLADPNHDPIPGAKEDSDPKLVKRRPRNRLTKTQREGELKGKHKALTSQELAVPMVEYRMRFGRDLTTESFDQADPKLRPLRYQAIQEPDSEAPGTATFPAGDSQHSEDTAPAPEEPPTIPHPVAAPAPQTTYPPFAEQEELDRLEWLGLERPDSEFFFGPTAWPATWDMLWVGRRVEQLLYKNYLKFMKPEDVPHLLLTCGWPPSIDMEGLAGWLKDTLRRNKHSDEVVRLERLLGLLRRIRYATTMGRFADLATN